MSWVQTAAHNEVLEGDGFHISFRPGTVEPLPISEMIGMLVRILGQEGNNSKDETALCAPERFPSMVNPYFILNGDFRKEYEGLVKLGWDACYAFWLSQPDCCSEWSHEPLLAEEKES